MTKIDIEMLECCAIEMLDWLAKAHAEEVNIHLDGLAVEIRRLIDKYDIME